MGVRRGTWATNMRKSGNRKLKVMEPKFVPLEVPPHVMAGIKEVSPLLSRSSATIAAVVLTLESLSRVIYICQLLRLGWVW